MSDIIAWSTALVGLVWLVETISSRFKSRSRSDAKRPRVWFALLAAITPLLFPLLIVDALLFGAGAIPFDRVVFPFQILGLIVAIGAVVVISRAKMELGAEQVGGIEAWNEQRLVNRGLYSLVRHPIYVGTIALGIGLGLGLWSWALLLADLAVALPLFRLLAGQEERLLVERFGRAYREYQARVPMLSPWPRPNRAALDIYDQPDVAEQE